MRNSIPGPESVRPAGLPAAQLEPLTGRWTKPYGGGVAQTVTVVMLVVGGFFVLVSGLLVVVGPATASANLIFWLGFEIAFWRIYRAGLLINDGGVRLRDPIRSRTIPWSEVRGFRSDRTSSNDKRIVIEVDGGPDIWTAVHQLGALPDRRTRLGSVHLDARDYAETLDRLEGHRLASTRVSRSGE